MTTQSFERTTRCMVLVVAAIVIGSIGALFGAAAVILAVALWVAGIGYGLSTDRN